MPRADQHAERAAALESLLQAQAGVAPPSAPTVLVPTGNTVYAGGDVERLLILNAPTLGYRISGGSFQRCHAVPGDIVQVTMAQANRLDRLGATLDPENLPAPPETEPGVVTDDDLVGMKAADLVAFVGQNPDERDRVRTIEEARGDKARTTVLDACAPTPDADEEAKAAELARQQNPPA